MINNLDKIIKKSGYKKEKIANEMGITKNTITNYVKGDSLPNVEIALKIADFLGCDIKDIFFLPKINNTNTSK